MKVHPRYRRYFRQALVFACIWLLFGLMYVFLEVGLLGGLTEYPSTGNKYDFKNSLIFTIIGSFSMGLLHGLIEVFWLKRRLAYMPFWKKILVKSIFYISFLVLFLITFTLIINARRYDVGVLDPTVVQTLSQFMQRIAFWSVVFYAAVILNVALFYSEMGEYLGTGVLRNYSLGRYHKPIQEIRIFMFLDMKSSTAIAENIGHKKYFDLLKLYYADMTDAVLETSGRIYQYVGDEIVISWSLKDGIYKNNCIRCFEKIHRVIEKNKDSYTSKFGIIPEFKAGYHIGEVTTGEIGVIKKDIIYTGDVMNTAARIQGKCNTYNAKALISGTLLDELQKKDPISFTRIGELILRGKKKSIQLYSVVF